MSDHAVRLWTLRTLGRQISGVHQPLLLHNRSWSVGLHFVLHESRVEYLGASASITNITPPAITTPTLNLYTQKAEFASSRL